ncbi:unnamed protein product [Schistocephalus solidus]|uniref:Sel1 repeat family protein n=1 Tax=Schistocephalus solidus TaxID=70667 RepID=A0A183T2E6_SCHSO|nr:unnamed protein product [Schistocephalus solidus]
MEGLQRRRLKLPAYVDRIPLARRRKPDSWMVLGVEAILIIFAVGVGTFTYYRYHILPLYAAKTFAHLGSLTAQREVSQYHLYRRHDPQHSQQAIYWLSKAAANGDELAAYNLAVAYLKGEIQGAKKETIHALLTQAARGGIWEAVGLLQTCGHGQCLQDPKDGSL